MTTITSWPKGAKNGVFAESLAKEKAIGLKQRQTFRAAHAAGVKMLFGTDAGVYPHGDNALGSSPRWSNGA
jgi:imidazolonepropionase-like amidohydrolase